MSEKKRILQLKNLSKQYGNVVAVENVTLDIYDGEFLTLLGPSGSGKTTILNMIAGFEFPTGGDIILQGNPINLLLPEKRNIGLVFQNYALFPHMTIFDNIAFPLKMRKVSKQAIIEKVKHALDLVQLTGFEFRYPKQLSGGQQQRIALARALVFDPPLLLLDEPLGALDKKLREHMQIELKHIHTQLNRTMIYVTHDQEEALVMSDRIVVLNKAKIEQVGAPDELYEKPDNEFVAGFIGESNILRGLVKDFSNGLLTLKLNDNSEFQFLWEGHVEKEQKSAFCIRPEKLFFVDDDSYPSPNLGGTIEEMIYVGETKRYLIRISPEQVIHLREMSNRFGNVHHPGDSVRIGWHQESLRKVS